MLRHFEQLVEAAIDESFEKGINLFLENLELDLGKAEVFQESTLDEVLEIMFNHAGIEVDAIEEGDEDLSNIDENELEAMISKLDQDIDNLQV